MRKGRRPKSFVGVDLGGTNVRAGLVVDGKIAKVSARALANTRDAKAVMADLLAVIEDVATPKIGGIGVGVPSLVDRRTGQIFDTINIPAWKNIPLRPRLQKKFSVPVEVDNDANCFALGELHFGQGRGCENFVGLVIGTGLGAGLIVNGRLHSGVDAGAGEFGMIPYGDAILEAYASGQFFLRRGLDGAEVARRAREGDDLAKAMFVELGEHIAEAFKIILYALAPERIVLGGSVGGSFELWRSGLELGLKKFGYSSIRDGLKISVSRLKHSAILGSASLLRELE